MGLNYASGAVVASVLAVSTAFTSAFEAESIEAASKVKLNKTNVELAVGKTLKLKLKGAKAVKFVSSNKKIAKVSKSGKITAKKAGSATITVYDESGKTYTCKVKVSKKSSGTKDYGNIDLGGIEIVIRDWWHPYDGTPTEPQSEYEEAKQAYQKEMMEKYNFTIKEVGMDDWGFANENFINYVAMGGDGNNYIWTLHPDTSVVSAMSNKCMYDLSTLDCLDFSDVKFASNKMHELYSKGSSVYAMFAGKTQPRAGVFFNKQVLKEAGIDPDSIYDMQAKGTWTWDAFEKLLKKVQRDLDGDGVDDVYGLTLNESIMTKQAVISNGGSFVSKDKKGNYAYNLESAETMEALKWVIDIYNKYDNHDSKTEDGWGVSWDLYKEEWVAGVAAFTVDQEYTAVQYPYSNVDFDMGFVMFPKGPKATDYVTEWYDNMYAIPACYDAEKAWKIAFAWNVYTDPVPGYEEYNEYVVKAVDSKLDNRALSETIPMMCEPEHGVVMYDNAIRYFYYGLGDDLTYNIGITGMSSETLRIKSVADLKSAIARFKDSWIEAIKEANK